MNSHYQEQSLNHDHFTLFLESSYGLETVAERADFQVSLTTDSLAAQSHVNPLKHWFFMARRFLELILFAAGLNVRLLTTRTVSNVVFMNAGNSSQLLR